MTNVQNRSRVTKSVTGWSLLLLWGCSGLAAANVTFDGDLVVQPCVVAAGKDTLNVEFDPVVNRELYAHQRTRGKSFAISLSHCDPSTASEAKVTFSGDEYGEELKGLLKAGEIAGIGIGIQSVEGEQVPLNHAYSYPVSKGDMQIPLVAYIQAAPSAIRSHNIEIGPFTATMNFIVSYQ